LEEHGDAYWEGDCFVFDQRVALDPTLSESKIQMCFNCREPLSEEEQLSEKYVLGETCPYCFDE
ncbi:MAG: pseudouridine synthase, partial [Candidatus Thalassarchaeaceae archaeon]